MMRNDKIHRLDRSRSWSIQFFPSIRSNCCSPSDKIRKSIPRIRSGSSWTEISPSRDLNSTPSAGGPAHGDVDRIERSSVEFERAEFPDLQIGKHGSSVTYGVRLPPNLACECIAVDLQWITYAHCHDLYSHISPGSFQFSSGFPAHELPTGPFSTKGAWSRQPDLGALDVRGSTSHRSRTFAVPGLASVESTLLLFS